jgi:hypothetical protein
MSIDIDTLRSALLSSKRPVSSSYDLYFYSRSYLQQGRDSTELSRKELLLRSGYANSAKFYRILDSYPNFGKPIPSILLELLNRDIEVLRTCIELDQEAYESQLKSAVVPTSFTVRMMAAMYCGVAFPTSTEPLTEQEAVDFVQNYSVQNNKQCCITFANLKTIWISPNHAPGISYYRPAMFVSERNVRFGTDGRGVATSRIG